MAIYCDLHTHSTISDGTDTPAELIALAEEKGLGAIALTDHNTVSGLPEFLREAQKLGVRAIHALSLPGKVAPVTAARAIWTAVSNILREEGL